MIFPHISYEELQSIVKFIYTGELEEGILGEEAEAFLELGDMYDMKALKDLAEGKLLRKLNKKTRQFCRKEKDLKHILQNPNHDAHLSKQALAYEATLQNQRLDGELYVKKKWLNIAGYSGWYRGEMQDSEAHGYGTW